VRSPCDWGERLLENGKDALLSFGSDAHLVDHVGAESDVPADADAGNFPLGSEAVEGLRSDLHELPELFDGHQLVHSFPLFSLPMKQVAKSPHSSV
jgi:hypothetical protein